MMSRALLRYLHKQTGRHRRSVQVPRRNFILGIETSCDDSGVAIISEDGRLLGEAIATQKTTRYGGVIPSFAMGFHAEALPRTTRDALKQASNGEPVSLDRLRNVGVELIAVTTRPGMGGSLDTGLRFAQYLAMKNRLPIIPVHHMEAHALTARMVQQIQFPFMVFLVSGGHCLLAMAEDVDKYKLLGRCGDGAPGQLFDKVARRLKLHTLRLDLRDVSGGRAMEMVGSTGDPTYIPFHVPMRQHRNCNFSVSGLQTHIMEEIARIESDFKTGHDEFIPNLPNFCASVEYTLSKHLCERLQRGIEFANQTEMWKSKVSSSGDDGKSVKTLVVSGGVAANKRLKSSIQKVCDALDCRLVVPEAKLCTDNGVMIAWNGLERYRAAQPGSSNLALQSSAIYPPDRVFEITTASKVPFGTDISKEICKSVILRGFLDRIRVMPWIWGKNRYLSEWHTGVGKTDPARHDVQVLSQGAFQQLMEQGQASNKGFTEFDQGRWIGGEKGPLTLAENSSAQQFMEILLCEPPKKSHRVYPEDLRGRSKQKKLYTFSKRSSSYKEKLAATRGERQLVSNQRMASIRKNLLAIRENNFHEGSVNSSDNGEDIPQLPPPYFYVHPDENEDSKDKSWWPVFKDVTLFLCVNIAIAIFLILVIPDFNLLLLL